MEKLNMGEYTAIVWASYIVAAVVLGVCAWVNVRALTKAKKRLVAIGTEGKNA